MNTPSLTHEVIGGMEENPNSEEMDAEKRDETDEVPVTWASYKEMGGVLPEDSFQKAVYFWERSKQEAEEIAAEVGIELTPEILDYYRILRVNTGNVLGLARSFIISKKEHYYKWSHRKWTTNDFFIMALSSANKLSEKPFETEPYKQLQQEFTELLFKRLKTVIDYKVIDLRDGAFAQVKSLVNQANRFLKRKELQVTPLVVDFYRILRENMADVLGKPQTRSVLVSSDNPRKWSDQRILAEVFLITGEYNAYEKYQTSLTIPEVVLPPSHKVTRSNNRHPIF